MFVCLCHGISDRQIRARCALQPSCSVAQIYQAQGVAPKCGKCVGMVRDLIAESYKSSDTLARMCELSPA